MKTIRPHVPPTEPTPADSSIMEGKTAGSARGKTVSDRIDGKAFRVVPFHPEERVDPPELPPKYRSLKQTKRENFIYTILLVIIACIVSVFALMPIVLTILNSFMSASEINVNYGIIFKSLSGNAGGASSYISSEPHLKLIPDMASFEQYETILFKSPTYLLKFWNSVFLVVPIVLFQMVVGSLAAFSFARYRRRTREVLFFIYIILMLMPFQVTLVPNYMIADWLHILNTPQAIILPGIFSTFSVFLLSKYMRQIPSSYIEAAKLDGAGEWHIFTRISMPMCKSALYAMGILLFIDYWNMVEQPLILLTDPEKQPLSVFLSQINSGEVGIAFAASFIFMIPPLLIFLHGEQYLIEGISRSGIK
jgi:multiple sugar transport system permease protein